MPMAEPEATPPEGGEKPPEIDFASPEVQKVLDQRIADQTKALKANATALKAEKDELSEKLKKWDGLNPEEVRTLLERVNTDEETRLVAEGKTDELLTRRTEQMRRDYESQVEARDKVILERDGIIKTQGEELKRLVVDSGTVNAAKESGMLSSAFDDAVRLARESWTVEKGIPVCRDADEKTIFGKDGTTPINQLEWLETLKESRPHWWPPSSGGGATGDTGIVPANGKLTQEQAGALSQDDYVKARRAGRI
jgi:hypothetical protein